MKIVLFGYGKMGQMIERIARNKGHEIACIIDPARGEKAAPGVLSAADVAIEFTVPGCAIDNYLACFDAGLPVVSGTTGWLKDWDYILDEAGKRKGGFFYASNFSLGVHLVFKMNRILAELMAEHPGYSSNIIEIHHTQKKDAPSGTAITLAEDLIRNHPAYDKWILNKHGEPNELPVFAIREGQVAGTHMVSYVSETDKISIRHEAFGREGFATGAVVAAEFMVGKSGVYSMNDLLA